jgi:hypothetical protein
VADGRGSEPPVRRGDAFDAAEVDEPPARPDGAQVRPVLPLQVRRSGLEVQPRDVTEPLLLEPGEQRGARGERDDASLGRGGLLRG